MIVVSSGIDAINPADEGLRMDCAVYPVTLAICLPRRRRRSELVPGPRHQSIMRSGSEKTIIKPHVLSIRQEYSCFQADMSLVTCTSVNPTNQSCGNLLAHRANDS